jgi:hypothetical protein
MRSKLGFAVAAIVVMGMFVGCGKKTAQAPPSGGVRKVRGVIVPAWAPKNPSPEFLRAAKVLKPLPDDFRTSTLPGPERQVALRRYAMTTSAIYEFFGTLSDEQIQKFVTSGEIRIPVKELTASQRKALNTCFERCDEANKDYPTIEESLVNLYKHGAAQDLSNVDVGFKMHNHLVDFFSLVKGPKGVWISGTFAYM